VELNFDAAEAKAAGITAEVMASALPR